MFFGHTDEREGLSVWLFTRGPNSDEDWQRYCDAIRHAIQVSAGHEVPHALQVIEIGSEDPNAKWRRQIADASSSAMPHARVVIVARSVVVRYTLTAIQWLQPPRCAVDLVASESEALEELERAKAGRAAKARAILAELRAHSSATPARAPST